MEEKIKRRIIKSVAKNRFSSEKPKVIKKFNLKTNKKNQFLAFFKPENFIDKTEDQMSGILNLALEKFDEFDVSIDGVAIYSGQTLGKYSIMDKHYGVINQLSKSASKILRDFEKNKILETLNLKGKNINILGGHEAFAISNINESEEFDARWLESQSIKIKSGFYVRCMAINDVQTVVVNGFHPHQLAHYTSKNRKLVVLLGSSDTPWDKLRTDMLGDSFPEKAKPQSIRGRIHRNAKQFGFKSVRIENNIMHLSAGPTEALFEINNFLDKPLGIKTLVHSLLAVKLREKGIKKILLNRILTNKDLHSKLEHVDTRNAIDVILSEIK